MWALSLFQGKICQTATLVFPPPHFHLSRHHQKMWNRRKHHSIHLMNNRQFGYWICKYVNLIIKMKKQLKRSTTKIKKLNDIHTNKTNSNNCAQTICLKFGEVWEMLWIFKVARWARNRWPKINKSFTVSNGIGASSFEIWTANLTQSLTVGTLTNSWSFIFGDSNWKLCSWLPRRPPKTRQMWTLWLGISSFLCFYFLVKKIKTCWVYKNTVFAKWEKYEVSWNFHLVFIINF